MTIDKRRRRPKPGQLPAFTPVPRLTQRHDGWTEERPLSFILRRPRAFAERRSPNWKGG